MTLQIRWFLFQSLLANGPSHPQNKYMKLENEIERSNQSFIEDTYQEQRVNNHYHYLYFYTVRSA